MHVHPLIDSHEVLIADDAADVVMAYPLSVRDEFDRLDEALDPRARHEILLMLAIRGFIHVTSLLVTKYRPVSAARSTAAPTSTATGVGCAELASPKRLEAGTTATLTYMKQHRRHREYQHAPVAFEPGDRIVFLMAKDDG